MKTTVEVLIEGYADFSNAGQWRDNCSVVFIETSGKKIIFDPGVDREELVKKLNGENLKVDDIDYVFISHNHIDHSLLMGIFPNASVVTGNHIYKGVYEASHDGKLLGDSVQIIHTPGHLDNHYSLIVDTNEGKYLIAGDLFWWSIDEKQKLDYESLINKQDEFVADFDKLKESRRKILKKVDFVIPGHGKMFQVNS